jgi:uncharacterized protein (DUF2344 family)
MSRMAKKMTTSFNLDKAISRVAKPSVFDRIVKEIDAREIPPEYVEQVLVQYYDGNIVELSGEDLTHPIPLDQQSTWELMEESFKKMKDVKIFINTDRLEKDINEMVEQLLGRYC